MKAQRRHELKTNALYAWLSSAQAWAETHRALVFVGLLVLIGVVSAVYLWGRRSRERPREAWALLSSAGAQDEPYQRLVNEYGSTQAGYEGRLLWANLLYEDRRNAKARENLQYVLDHAGSNEYLGARALVGLATLAEQERRTDEAVGLYGRLIDEYPAPAYLDLAKKRLAALKSPHRETAPPLAFVEFEPDRFDTSAMVPVTNGSDIRDTPDTESDTPASAED